MAALLAQIPVRPYGVLGQQLTLRKKFIDVAPFPGTISGCVFVDPAGLHHIQPPGGPANAHGSAGAIYKAIGIQKEAAFPPDVIEHVKAAGDAKYHLYTIGAMDVHVIHTVLRPLRVYHPTSSIICSRSFDVPLVQKGGPRFEERL